VNAKFGTADVLVGQPPQGRKNGFIECRSEHGVLSLGELFGMAEFAVPIMSVVGGKLRLWKALRKQDRF
jgi:hypothetical protein